MSLKVIKFRNLETNIDINLPLDKKLFFIYGKNGCGKTTMSKSEDLDAKYVFNDLFIYRNVYVIDGDGAKSDASTKKGLSELFIGEDVIVEKKEIEKTEIVSKEIKERIKELQLNIDREIAPFHIKSNIYNSLLSLFANHIYDYTKTIEEQIKDFKYEETINSTIKDKDELNTIHQQIIKSENLMALLNIIQRNPLVNDYIFDNKQELIKEFNSGLNELYSSYIGQTKLEELILTKNIKGISLDHIKVWTKLHIDRDSCAFCGNKDIKKNLKEWQVILNDEILKYKDEIINKLKEANKIICEVLKTEELYISVAPNTIKNIKKMDIQITNILSSIDKKEEKYFDIENRTIDETTKDINEKQKQISNYLIKPFEKNIVFLNASNNHISSNIKEHKAILDKLLEKNAVYYKENINVILTELGLNKEIEIIIDRAGGTYKYAIKIKGTEIGNLSDGQKHKLALAIFLCSLKNKSLKDKILVFDDPVVSLDELGYHLFKNYLIKNIMNATKDEIPILIIMTHNFNYLYIQISNIINNTKLLLETNVLKLNSGKFKNIDINLFKLDDIALFKKALDELKYKDELVLIACMYSKMFREFLDLKLRLLGKPTLKNPAEEIDELLFTSKLSRKLKYGNTFLNRISKKKKVTIKEALDGFEELKKLINILGFEDYLIEKYSEKLKTLKEKDGDEITDLFLVIQEVKKILHSDEEKYFTYKNYLSHPRISYTKSILATSLDC